MGVYIHIAWTSSRLIGRWQSNLCDRLTTFFVPKLFPDVCVLTTPSSDEVHVLPLGFSNGRPKIPSRTRHVMNRTPLGPPAGALRALFTRAIYARYFHLPCSRGIFCQTGLPTGENVKPCMGDQDAHTQVLPKCCLTHRTSARWFFEQSPRLTPELGKATVKRTAMTKFRS